MFRTIEDDEMDSYVESRGGIDSAQCYDCGRNMIIYCDDKRTREQLICSWCKQGLAPEW